MAKIKVLPPSEIKFLIPLNYNNVYSRLRSVLGSEASLFAEIQKKSREIIWYAPDGREFQSFNEATPELALDVKDTLQLQLNRVRATLRRDPDLEKYADAIVSYPSDDVVFFASKSDGSYEVLIAAWGCVKASDAIGKEDDKSVMSTPNSESHSAGTKTAVQESRKDRKRLNKALVSSKQKKGEKGGGNTAFFLFTVVLLFIIGAIVGCFFLLNRDKTGANQMAAVSSTTEGVGEDTPKQNYQYVDSIITDSVTSVIHDQREDARKPTQSSPKSPSQPTPQYPSNRPDAL